MRIKKIASFLLVGLPALMLVFSSVLKFMADPELVEGLTKTGFLPFVPLPLLALVELICAVLLLLPATQSIGFFGVCGYLGGAASIELAAHRFPVALVLLTLVWIGMYLRKPGLFVKTPVAG